jgi:hypothetical protein
MGNSYLVLTEPETFLEKLLPGQTIHLAPGTKMYFYTAIFAPARVSTTIVHQWQYYDEKKEEWQDKGSLSFAINGGRKEGYKGYTWNSGFSQGKWRVYVKNQQGQVLGRFSFNVVFAAQGVDVVEMKK